MKHPDDRFPRYPIPARPYTIRRFSWQVSIQVDEAKLYELQ